MKNKHNLITFILGLSFSTSLMADYSLSTNLDIPNVDGKRESSLTGDFGLRTNQLVEDVGEVTGNQHYGELNLKYQSYNSANTYKGFEISTRVNDEEQMMYSIKEALVEYRFSDSRFAMGRTNLEWSHADKIWGLGKINNRVNFDYFEPGQEGLVGLFYDKKFNNGFNTSVFASMIYVPELNPSLQINDDGTIECKNPWCSAPADSTEIEGKDIPIYYNVNYPDVSEAVLKYSMGLKVGQQFKVYNSKDMNLTLSGTAFYIRKPENSVSVTAEVRYETDKNRVFVDATPQFYYHDVKGGNLELDIEEWNLKLYGSAISIVPNKFPDGNELLFEYTGIKPKKLQEDYLSGGAIFNDGDWQTHFGYIARVSEFDRKDDILVEYPRWNQALHLAIEKNLTRKINVSLDYKYDMLTEDRLTMFNTSYRFGPSVIASLGVNIIGTDPEQESFWSEFENNDSVYSSLKYTF